MMEQNISRKDFFKLAVKNGKSCVASLMEGYTTAAQVIKEAADKKAPPPLHYLRPPGALPEKEFLKTCTKCEDCLKACPHWVIRKAGSEFGNTVANTPIVVPLDNPCLFCEDLPCIRACEAEALKLPIDGKTLKIGLALVSESACYQAQGQPCDYCMVHCPERPKAIRADKPGTLPHVSLELCTGCGKCAQICPPGAIRITDVPT